MRHIRLANLMRENLHAFTGKSSDYDSLIKQIGEVRFVTRAVISLAILE